MAGYVEDIIKACNKGCGRDTCVRGQLFDGGGFNVVVRYVSYSCLCCVDFPQRPLLVSMGYEYAPNGS